MNAFYPLPGEKQAVYPGSLPGSDESGNPCPCYFPVFHLYHNIFL